jgi:hypothetical protein
MAEYAGSSPATGEPFGQGVQVGGSAGLYLFEPFGGSGFPGRGFMLQQEQISLNLPPTAGTQAGNALLDFDDAHEAIRLGGIAARLKI